MIQLGSLTAKRVRIVTPWNGVWFADVELVLDEDASTPSGKTVLTLDNGALVGTIDPRATGRLGANAFVRLVGGGMGWDQPVAALSWHNDAGVLSSTVIAATALAVGETAVDQAPVRLGIDYARFAGPASRVLAGRDWYVDASGITQVGPRPPAVAPSDLTVVAWEPHGQVVELGTTALVVPGLSLTDDRWDGAIVVRDVEQVFSDEGSRITATCAAAPGSRLQTMLQSAIQEWSGITFAKTYKYRVVSQGADGRLTLQAVSKAPGAPDVKLVTAWYGVPGVGAKVTPGTVVRGSFFEGDRTLIMVDAFDATPPAEVDLGATTKVSMTAPEVDLNAAKVKAGGALPVAMATPLATWAANVTAAINALAPGAVTALATCASTTLSAGGT